MSYNRVFDKTKSANAFCSLLISVTIGAGLFTNHLFINSSLFPYFLYTFSSLLFVLVAGSGLLQQKALLKIGNETTFLAFLFWLAFVSIQGFTGVFTYRHWFMIISILFYLALVLKISRLNVLLVFKGITLLVLVEAVFCFLQWFRVLAPLNTYFPVTGTWVNPNVSAMFLAICFPAILYVLYGAKGKFRYLLVIVLLLAAVSLLLLKCRSAYMGAGAASVVFLTLRYRLTEKLRKSSSFVKGIMVLSILAIALLLAPVLYHSKKASADGRKLIWKLSAEMVLEKPFTGHGYGLFERYYNLYQAKYFQNGRGSYQEQQGAGFVNMAYNEFLENAVEGGGIGLLIFLTLLTVLLAKPPLRASPTAKTYPANNYQVAYAGIVAFAVMSLVNFTVQAIPVMAVFVLYAAIITQVSVQDGSGTSGYLKAAFFQLKPGSLKLLGCILIVFSLFLLSKQIPVIYAQWQTKKVSLLVQKRDYVRAIHLLKPLEKELYNSEGYLRLYAKALYGCKSYNEAIKKYQQAKAFTSSPEVYRQNAFCHIKTGDFLNAEKGLFTALYIEPNSFFTRDALLKLYLKAGATRAAKAMAQDIITLNPKIPSAKVDAYKVDAMKALSMLKN